MRCAESNSAVNAMSGVQKLCQASPFSACGSPLKGVAITQDDAYGHPMGESAMTHVEERDREFLQARENFATLFHASQQFLCIIQFNSLPRTRPPGAMLKIGISCF
jgi:hypothetical protein